MFGSFFENRSMLSVIDQGASLGQLLACTPCLRHLTLGLIDGRRSEQLSSMMSSIEILKFSFDIRRWLSRGKNDHRSFTQTPNIPIDDAF